MDQKGQTLLEIIAVVAVIGLVLISLVRGLTLSLKNVQFTKERSAAENYAREVTEWLIYERDHNWDNIGSHLNTYCLISLAWPEEPGSSSHEGNCVSDDYISGTVYRREVVITDASGTPPPDPTPTPRPQAEIVVTISWDSPRGGETFSLTFNLARWK